MKIIQEIENALDRALGIFAPHTENARRLDRVRGELIRKRQYAAAKTSRLTGDWSPADQDVNSLIRTSSPQIRARSRQLVRDFAYFARAVDVLTDYTVGTGVIFQSRVTRGIDTGGKAKLHTSIIRQIEDAFSRWMDEADAGGRLHYHEMEQLAKRQDVECGEFLFIKTASKDPKRFIPFALLAYEADWLTSNGANVERGNLVDQGIEFDPATGRAVAFHFAVPDGFNSVSGGFKTQRIVAENVIHGFKTLRPGQLRGISPFTTAILLANDLNDYLDAEIDAAKMAAKYLAIIETPDIAGFQGMRSTMDADTGQKIESIENAIIEYTRPGEKINFANGNRPGSSFEPFTRLVLRMVAISTGLTYELLTGDYAGINYSNLRGIRNDFQKGIAPLQKRHIRQFSQPVLAAFMESAVLSGKLKLPGYFTDPRKYLAAIWQPPGVESIDPLREGKAWIEQINNGLRSPQEITAGRGRDYEDVLNEIAEAKRLAKDKNLDFDPKPTSTALKTNPASVAPETAD